ncbi:MAG: hypothetical protein WBR26_09205 [Candidatus Acidiferrum sp.]
MFLAAAFGFSAFAPTPPTTVHGLWVWKSPTVLEAPNAVESLRDFCSSEDVNEVYVSISERSEAEEEAKLVRLISLLHRSSIKVEALLSSTEADEPGKHRDTLLRHVQGILDFNRRHSAQRFDGIHLDIEPQQRPENKGPGNLRFLPGLADAYRAVVSLAQPAGLTVNADIQNKLLKGDLGQRKMLLSAIPRLTLMMYELSNPTDGTRPDQKAEKVQETSRKFMEMAYAGLEGDHHLAKMAIALRTPDYNELLPRMLDTLDGANRTNLHYLGWARHSYNDHLKAEP